jgi:hypothetical protein
MLTTIDLAEGGGGARQDAILVEDIGESDIPPVSRRMRVNTQRGARRKVGEPVFVTLDLARLLFFDATSKLAIA